MSYERSGIDFESPAVYMEAAFLRTPDLVPRALSRYAHPDTQLPEKLEPHCDYIAHRAALHFGVPGEFDEGKAAAYRGLKLSHALAMSAIMKGDPHFSMGPIGTRQSGQALYNNIIFSSGQMYTNSPTIKGIVDECAPLLDPLDEQPFLTRYGILMGINMANYGEIRKRQLMFGKRAVKLAERVFRQTMAAIEVDEELRREHDDEVFKRMITAMQADETEPEG